MVQTAGLSSPPTEGIWRFPAQNDWAIRLLDLKTGEAVRDMTWKKDLIPKRRKGAYPPTFSPDAKSLVAG